MKKLFIETYGCQMNFADSEVVASILKEMYTLTKEIQEADLILINTCSIRDKAEQRIHKRLKELEAFKRKKRTLQVGLLGCMAERMKEELLETEPVLDFIAGPDAYRTLPELIAESQKGQTTFNVLLSEEETYDNIMPVRYDANGVSAFVSIMRGCNNFCSYCVVPYTRGRERSRSPKTILGEIEDLLKHNYKEVTLLGQNVNSYFWKEEGQEVSFAKLMAMVAEMSPEMRVRFATASICRCNRAVTKCWPRCVVSIPAKAIWSESGRSRRCCLNAPSRRTLSWDSAGKHLRTIKIHCPLCERSATSTPICSSIRSAAAHWLPNAIPTTFPTTRRPAVWRR